jgi:lipopolysaccharide transport system permease protein
VNEPEKVQQQAAVVPPTAMQSEGITRLSLARDTPRMYDFVWTLIRTDIKARYKGAISGLIWAMLKPLAMFIVMYSVFSFLFTERKFSLYLIVGLLLWNFYNEGTRVGMESLQSKGYLLTKAIFPRSIVVVASTANAVITLVVFSVSIMFVVLVFGKTLSLVGVLMALLYAVELYFIVLGISLGTSVLYLRYRDLNQIWEVLLQAGFFVAPIVYPLNIIPEKYHIFLYFWPPTPVIQFSRMVLVDNEIPSLRANMLLAVMAVVIFGLGVLIFRRFINSAVERI